MKYLKTFLLGGVFLIFCSAVWADIPKQINFQGVLRDSLGNPYPDGNYSLTFRIYNAASGGTIFWQEVQTIPLSGGLFTTLLGSVTPIPESAFTDSLRWLGIQIASNPEITPRRQLVSVPYSYVADFAQDADKLDGMNSSDFALSGHTHPVADTANFAKKSDTANYSLNSDLLDGLNSTDFLNVSSDFGRSGVATDLYEGAFTLTNKYVNATGPDSVVSTSGTAFLGKSSGSSGSIIVGVSGDGANNSTGNSYGVLGNASNFSTGTAQGGFFSTTSSGTGAHYGVSGIAQGSSAATVYGSFGSAFHTSTGNAYGSYGTATNTSTGTAFGGYFTVSSSGGTGTHYGVYGDANSSSSNFTYGSYGTANNTSTGLAFGGYFETSVSGTGSHFGVYGSALGSSSGITYGTYGTAQNTSTGLVFGGYFRAASFGSGTHSGVYAEGEGSSSNPTYGSFAYAQNTSTGIAYGGRFEAASFGTGAHYGVWGLETAGGSGAAVYAAGDFAGSGAKYAVAKTSQGHRLLSVIESPEVWFEDFGEGELINGKAHIELDPLFLETVTINSSNPMKVFIQLTSGNPVNVVVSKGITGFDVTASDNSSNATFDYRILAKRKGYENQRLKATDVGMEDPNLYPELWQEIEKRHQETKIEKNLENKE